MATPQSKKRSNRRNQDPNNYNNVNSSQSPGSNETTLPSSAQGVSRPGSRTVSSAAGGPEQGGSADDQVSKTASKKPRQNRQKQKKEAQNGAAAPNSNPSGLPNYTSSPSKVVQPQRMPPSDILSTPAKNQTAYAGPAFHASPAASALPMPKFFSQSMPTTSSQPTLGSRLAAERDSEKSESSPSSENSPCVPIARPVNSTTRERNESPLDVFFKADKAERARQHSNSSITSSASQQPSTVARAERPAGYWNSIYGNTPKHHSRNFSTGSGKDVFTMELDGTSLARPSVGPLASAAQDGSSGLRSSTAPSAIPRSTSEPFSGFFPPPQHSYSAYGRASSGAPFFHQTTSAEQQSPFNRPTTAPVTPQSAGSASPHQTTPNHSSLHYGNRNLSPLFKAAKNDSARPQSHLRREVTALSPTSSGVELPGSEPLFNKWPTRGKADSSAVALEYLQSQFGQSPAETRAKSASAIRNVAPAILELDGQGTPSSFDQSKGNAVLQSPDISTHQQQPSSSPDINSMENDLRRILKLSPGGTTGVH
jgi:Proline-rich nuclear receptor coactivator motif